MKTKIDQLKAELEKANERLKEISTLSKKAIELLAQEKAKAFDEGVDEAEKIFLSGRAEYYSGAIRKAKDVNPYNTQKETNP